MRTLILGSVLSLVACTNVASGPSRSSGSLAASTDSALLYAADTDNGVLGVIDLKSRIELYEVKVGTAPWRVTVGADDTIYVANRGSRSISVIRKGEHTVFSEIATAVDPVGLVTSPDGRTLYVVCSASAVAAEYGTLAAFDTATLAQKWSLDLGDEPRGIALIGGDRAVVSLYHAGDVVQIDLKTPAILKSGSEIYAQANSGVLASGTYGGTDAFTGSTFHPRGATDVVVTPDLKRIFVAAVLSRESPILTQPTPDTPYYKGQGPRLVGSVTTSAVFTLDVDSKGLTPIVDDVSGYGGNATGTADHPQTSYAVSGSGVSKPLQGPTVGVVDATGDWLFLVNRETSNLAVISATQRQAKETDQPQGNSYNYYGASAELPSVHSVAEIGPGSDGVVVMGDNARAFVYSQFNHQVYEVGFDSEAKKIVAKGALPLTVGVEVLSPALVAGRKLFFDANDRRISAVEASVACSSCHLEGRDDSHTWNFPDGPRQTPTLAGRGTLETPPYHWSGEFKTLPEFLTHTVTARMGGTGLDASASQLLNQYIGSIPAPENPYLKAELSPEQARGQLVFAKAQCASCHSGKWLTNNLNANVGTLAKRDNGIVVANGVNVPSLRGLARSGPYLHDGSVTTLSDRLTRNPGDKHGVTSALNAGELSDLVAYLRAQ